MVFQENVCVYVWMIAWKCRCSASVDRHEEGGPEGGRPSCGAGIQVLPYNVVGGCMEALVPLRWCYSIVVGTIRKYWIAREAGTKQVKGAVGKVEWLEKVVVSRLEYLSQPPIFLVPAGDCCTRTSCATGGGFAQTGCGRRCHKK